MILVCMSKLLHTEYYTLLRSPSLHMISSLIGSAEEQFFGTVCLSQNFFGSFGNLVEMNEVDALSSFIKM